MNVIQELLEVSKYVRNLPKTNNIMESDTFRQIAIVIDDIDNVIEDYDRLEDKIKEENANG